MYSDMSPKEYKNHIKKHHLDYVDRMYLIDSLVDELRFNRVFESKESCFEKCAPIFPKKIQEEDSI